MSVSFPSSFSAVAWLELYQQQQQEQQQQEQREQQQQQQYQQHQPSQQQHEQHLQSLQMPPPEHPKPTLPVNTPLTISTAIEPETKEFSGLSGVTSGSQLDVRDKASSLQKTVLAVISLTQQRHVAEVENASLRSSLEETQLKLQESDASEERVLRMLHESQKELALLQQMQMESNRLNASLLVRLNVMRAQEADNLVSAETPESRKLHDVLHSDWEQQQQMRDSSMQEASLAINQAASATDAARAAMASAAERQPLQLQPRLGKLREYD